MQACQGTLKSQSFLKTISGKRCYLFDEVPNLVEHKLQAIRSRLATVRGEPVLRMKPAHSDTVNTNTETLVPDDSILKPGSNCA